MKALIVEPHPGTTGVLQQVLESLGVTSVLCEDAECARDILGGESPSLVVLDQVLPGEDGFEFAREIREMQIPAAVVVVASCSPADCVEAMLSDPDDVIFRPLEPSYLRIRFALAVQRAQQRSREHQITITAQALVKALETMQLGVTISDLEGRILFINQADAAMHGYGVDELIGKNVRLFSPSMRWNWLTVEQMKHLKSWKRDSINVRKDGSIFQVQLLSDVIKGSSGEVIGLVTTCEDLSDPSVRPSPEQAMTEISG